MTDRAPERLAAGVALLVAAAGVVLALGSRRTAAAEARSAAFQGIVGGLGSGTATSLSPCEAAFDGGVSGTCSAGLDPGPGAFAFCPHHAGASLRR